jgi:DNA invertase Pin-like site-specific DNA recombinase
MQDKRSNQLRLVGYARVSTQGQALQHASVPEQEADMRAWCEAQGHSLVAVCAEEGGVCGGAEGLADRFAFIDALDMVKTGEADGVIVRDLDRLSRDVVIQEQLLRDIWAAGGEVLSTRDSERENLVNDPKDPTRKLLRVVMGAVAEWEREKLRLRLQAGRRAKSRQGHYVGGFGRKYGYRLADNGKKSDWEAVPEQQEVIARIREQRGGGATLRAIAGELNDAGTAPPSGREWYPATVKLIAERAAA